MQATYNGVAFTATSQAVWTSLSIGTDNPELSSTIASAATMKLARLSTSNLFYTPIEERFERLTRIARVALDVPVAAVTLINSEKQWFKSVSGWDVTELPMERSLCQWTLDDNQVTIIEDTSEDPRTLDHPLVEFSPKFRFYAGCPLKDAENRLVGTLCTYDINPRKFSAVDRQCLRDLAALTHREFHADQLAHAHAAMTAKLGIARREAMMDPLTRLWNRRGAMVMLHGACQEADQTDRPLAVALLDLDNFKRVNDTYGHSIGDEVLRRLGSCIISCIRDDDVTCRIGGDEFLLLISDADAQIAAHVAERLRRSITETAIATRQGNIPISISIGFTIREPNENVSAEELLERADKGLLQSKSSGRNSVRCA